ncbi:hypothetical protein SLA2020_068110 [Shorea laevis]
MIGKGGFGEVYFGTLKDGTDVAVKKLISSSEQCRKAFLREAKLLTNVRHRNLVSLVGYCDEDGKEALILEYMSNGSLKQHLSEMVLIWIERLRIALDVACGLEYLHGRQPPIVHRDLKPDNILFNKYFHVKIVDFGLSRDFPTESATHVSTEHPAGTPGYRDPDSWRIGHIRKKHDVYSFGIIILELVTGKPAIITRDNNERITIIEWIDPFIKKGHIQKIVDPRLNGELNISVAQKVIEIAVSCVNPIIEERPDVSQILTKLKKCLDGDMGDDTSGTNILVRLYRNIRQRQKGTIMKSMGEQQPLNLGNLRIFTHSEVVSITSNFKDVIEKGRHYKVYHGTLNPGAHVAVKIWSPLSSDQEYYEFQTEVEQLSPLCHRNVVFAVGYCDENDTKALIYEYMTNGNLSQHLSGEYQRILCWNERLQIAIDIAHGLEYLQMCCNSFIVHRNLSPIVILLNEKMRGKIADFRFATILKEVEESAEIRGAFQYWDPQYLRTRKLNKKTDLYSYGIILLELLTGLPVAAWGSGLIVCGSRVLMMAHVESLIERGNIELLVDPRLATHANFRNFVRSAGAVFYPLGGDPRVLAGYMARNKGLIPSGPGEISMQRKQLKAIIESLLPACTEPDMETGVTFRAQAIIANPPAFGHTHVAEALRVPIHIFFTMPWTPTYEFPHPLARVPQSAGYWLSYIIVELLTWWSIRGYINDFRKRKLKLAPIAYFSTYRGSLSHLPMGYMWSPNLVPKPKDWSPLVDVVGYCFLNLGSKYQPQEEFVQWIQKGPQPIYIGFGSMPLENPIKTTDIILEALKVTGQRGIIDRGWGDLGLFIEVPENIFLLEDCPHDWLFPQCSAVVHHGGAGTTATGLKAGCPTTIVPFFGDQFFWGDRVHEKGLGPASIPISQLNVENLSNAIRFMLQPEVKSQAMELAKLIENEDGVAAAVDAFHRHLPPEVPLPTAPVGEDDHPNPLQWFFTQIGKRCWSACGL